MFEYVERAIREKIDIFGFSDHGYMSFDPEYRMKKSQIGSYLNEISLLKERFKDKIEILSGFEVDYLKGKMSSSVLDAPVDYLIGSVHFLQEWGFDNPEFIGRYKSENIDELWKNYFKEIEDMAKSGIFQIAGHLDLLKVFKFMPSERLDILSENSLKAIKKGGMALEVNGSGYRKPIGEPYPSRTILEMAFDMNIPITLGSDAHKPEQVGMFHDKLERLVKEIGFKEVAVFRDKKIDFIEL
jgi:histidinol-phosphatase (PHP family)